MPESYIEPMTNRQECFTCHKKVKGKKKLSKCSRCHAITYCGKECQVADFTRHKWNCLPVMVTEIPGKGRGLVAARDIKQGELIFTDKPVITVNSDFETGDWKTNFMVNMDSVLRQLDKLPSEAKQQFDKMQFPKTDEDVDGVLNHEANRNLLTMKKFLLNSRRRTSEVHTKCTSLYLNIVLVNHSCAPNAAEGNLKPYDESKSVEVRAIKSIVKGDEVTICYENDFSNFCCCFGGRREKIKENFGFDCNCQYCASPDQEDLMWEIFNLHADLGDSNAESSDNHLNMKLSHWAKDAEILGKIVSVGEKIRIGGLKHKWTMMVSAAKTAHLARNQDLLKNAMQMLENFAGVTKLEIIEGVLKDTEQELCQWSSQLLSKQPPTKAEIDFFFPLV